MQSWSVATRVTAIIMAGVVFLGGLAILVFGKVEESIVREIMAGLMGALATWAARLSVQKTEKPPE